MKFADFKSKLDKEEKADKTAEEPVGRIRNLEFILDVTKSINRSLILEDVLELVLKNAIQLTASDRGFIVLRNNDGKLEYKLGLDDKENILPESAFQVSMTVVEDVFYTGQSKFIEGAQSDTEHDPSKSILSLELQTILCSPLLTHEKNIGVIYVDSKHLHKIKIREITDTFEILAGQAAIAIRNAQLFNNQVNAYNALQEANAQLIQAERKALKSSIDAELGQALQGLVHFALLETESLLRVIEKAQKEIESKFDDSQSFLFDRIKLKSKVAVDSIRNIQKYAQILLETSLMNMNKENEDLNETIQSVIRYISPMKKFQKVMFNTELKNLPMCNYDSEQIQHLLVHLFSNSAEAKPNANILVKSYFESGQIFTEIYDDGPGFKIENPDSFFEFPSPHRKGYGLFLCKSIIDRHNGSIRILDKPSGAAVQISFPVN